MVTGALKVIAIVPARSGSKGIPGKNTRLLAQHPLLAWSIAAGRQSRLVERVLVSTDDMAIAKIARSYGAETPFIRPAAIARDETPDLPVFEHALEWLERHEGYRPDILVQLRPTSPLRPPDLVDLAVGLLASDDAADSVRAVTNPSQNPYKMWTVSDGALKPLLQSEIPEPYNAPRQSLPETLWQTGHIDVFRARTILEKRSLTGDRILPIHVDPRYAMDIDDLVQWRIAEEILSGRQIDFVEPDAAALPLLAGIRMYVFDFDGVFTDNTVYVREDGVESVGCSRADGLGIERLRRHGIEAAVLSSEDNPVVAARCRKLKIPVAQGLKDKGSALRQLARSKGLLLDQIAYVGNDLNDMECFRIARAAIAPADAHPDVRKAASLVLRRRGGAGAVREVCDLAIRATVIP